MKGKGGPGGGKPRSPRGHEVQGGAARGRQTAQVVSSQLTFGLTLSAVLHSPSFPERDTGQTWRAGGTVRACGRELVRSPSIS